jgi:hypothetical protein
VGRYVSTGTTDIPQDEMVFQRFPGIVEKVLDYKKIEAEAIINREF